jgi:hypothetical protein
VATCSIVRGIEASLEKLILPPESAEYVVRKLSDAIESKTKEKGTILKIYSTESG